MWWLWACTGELSDRDRYLQARQEPARAIEFCSAIRNEDEQGECLLFAATEGQHGSSACQHAHAERWKEACFFEVIDKKGVPKHQARDSCARTGQFRNRCVYHIVQREEQALMNRFPKGKEEELSTYIRSEIIALGGEELEHDPLSETLVSRIIARRFRKQWREQPTRLFSQEFCGRASEEICTKAYRFVVRLGKRVPKPCVVPPQQSLCQKNQIPFWEPSFQKQAIRVWSEICRQGH